MHFDWSPIGNEDWRALLMRCPRANILQSWPHAVAARMHDQMMSRRARIFDGGGEAGIMQIQDVRIGPFHVLRLHRGPLWFEGEADAVRWRGFFAAFNRSFPRRIGRWRHILPEMDAGQGARELLAEAGFRQRNSEAYRTILLDLSRPTDEIRGKLRGKWRNALNQAERAGLEAEGDAAGLTAKRFLDGYDADKGARGYRGAKPARLATMIASAAPANDALIFNARQNGETIAAMLFFRHGPAATYQAGWTSEAGRAARAHHLLLWRAICHLKGQGTSTLDLGGVHPRMAEGVTRFKDGLGGTPLTLPGIYG